MDLIDENGSIYDFQKLKDVFKIHGTYLDYMQLINKIPRLWRDMINENSRKIASFKYTVQVHCYAFYLLQKKQGRRDIYHRIIPVNEIIVPNKWSNEIGNISLDEWKKFNKNLYTIKEVKIRDFKFKINNPILVKNTFLFKIKKKENDLPVCSYCNHEAENITHILFHCGAVTKFWNDLKMWLERKS